MSRIPEIVEELRALLPGDLVRYHYINALLDEIRWWAEWEQETSKFEAILERLERMSDDSRTSGRIQEVENKAVAAEQ